MDQEQSNITLDESILQVVKSLPEPIRRYISRAEYSTVLSQLMRRYALRVDQSAVLEREILLLLIGVEDSEQFTKSLVEEGNLDQGTMNLILTDVNTLIFEPLRAEMEHGAANAVKPAPRPAVAPEVVRAPEPVRVAPAPVRTPPAPERLVMPEDLQPVAPSPSVAPGVIEPPPPPPPPVAKSYVPPKYVPEYAQGTYAPPPQSPAYPTRENATTYIHHVAPLPKRSPVNKIQPAPAKPAAAASPKPQEITDRARLLEDREEPHINFPASPRAVARTAPPPPNLPGTFPEHTAPVAEPIIQKPLQTRPYSVDPYREPIDEGRSG